MIFDTFVRVKKFDPCALWMPTRISQGYSMTHRRCCRWILYIFYQEQQKCCNENWQYVLFWKFWHKPFWFLTIGVLLHPTTPSQHLSSIPKPISSYDWFFGVKIPISNECECFWLMILCIMIYYIGTFSTEVHIHLCKKHVPSLKWWAIWNILLINSQFFLIGTWNMEKVIGTWNIGLKK